MTRLLVWAAACLMACCAMNLSGCAMGRKSDPVDPATKATDADYGTQNLEDRLRHMVRTEIEIAQRNAASDRDKVRHRTPYFYREYADFPSGGSDIRITLIQTENKATPYRADASYPKVRYVTKLHPRRNDALEDKHFYRGTGTETATYELRHGRWTRTGRVFVADTVEENIGGTWSPVNENTEKPAASDEEKGWFGRVFGGIFGR